MLVVCETYESSSILHLTMDRADTDTTADNDSASVDSSPVLIKYANNVQCAFSACQSHRRYCPNLSFYRFPKDAVRCKLWVDNCGNSGLIGKSPEELNIDHYLCAQHFEPSQFKDGSTNYRLIPKAIPTVFVRQERVYTETDHDYSSVPLICSYLEPSCSTSSPTQADLPMAVLTCVSNAASTSKSATVKSTVNTGKVAPVSTNGSVSLTRGAIKRVATQQKGAPVVKRVMHVKETPLQKYMLLCSELKSDLKGLQKHREEGEKLSADILNLLLKQTDLLPFEDAILLTGAVVNFLEDRYRLTAQNSIESAVKMVQEEQLLQGTTQTRKQPTAEVAVFVLNEQMPGQVILGKRRITVGGGLYQVPCGEIEFGETWEEAAYREVFESTSLHITRVSVCSIVDTVEHSANYHGVTVFMRGFVDARWGVEPRALQPCRCDSWHWRKWADMPPADALYWSLRDYTLENLQPFC